MHCLCYNHHRLNVQDFIDLLMATEHVRSCEVTQTTEVYWKFYVQSEGVKQWNSFLTVMRGNDEEMWCLMECTFTPETQLRAGKKYIFTNEWNKEQIFRPHLFVGGNGTISMERSFAINMKWVWSVVYDQFASETIRFLESIDVMQSQLRIEEDAANEQERA